MTAVPAWLPNLVTTVRIALVPVWGLLAELSWRRFEAAGTLEPYRSCAVAVLCAIGASDLLDGWLARRFGLASAKGATLDALADKLAQVVLLAFFTFRGPPAYAGIPLWFLVLVFARDLLLLCGYLALRGRRGGVRVEHRPHGKLASSLLFALLLGITLGAPEEPVRVAVPVLAAVVVLSTAAYVRDGVRQMAGR